MSEPLYETLRGYFDAKVVEYASNLLCGPDLTCTECKWAFSSQKRKVKSLSKVRDIDGLCVTTEVEVIVPKLVITLCERHMVYASSRVTLVSAELFCLLEAGEFSVEDLINENT